MPTHRRTHLRHQVRYRYRRYPASCKFCNPKANQFNQKFDEPGDSDSEGGGWMWPCMWPCDKGYVGCLMGLHLAVAVAVAVHGPLLV